MQGEPLGKDCYKIRMAITSKGKGKSGGSRPALPKLPFPEAPMQLLLLQSTPCSSIPFF